MGQVTCRSSCKMCCKKQKGGNEFISLHGKRRHDQNLLKFGEWANEVEWRSTLCAEKFSSTTSTLLRAGGASRGGVKDILCSNVYCLYTISAPFRHKRGAVGLLPCPCHGHLCLPKGCCSPGMADNSAAGPG